MPTVRVTPSAPQSRVLISLKRCGDATADELASVLDISPSAVRQHLSALRSLGFVSSRQDRGQPGRPADRYEATPLAESLFVSSGSSLSVELLDHIAEEDFELVNRIFQRRRVRLVNDANDLMDGESVEERVAGVTELLDAQGYLSDSDKLDETTYRINLHSCAIWDVANQYQQACAAELDLIRELIPAARVKRVALKTDGAHTCAYEVTLPT